MDMQNDKELVENLEKLSGQDIMLIKVYAGALADRKELEEKTV